MGHKIFIDPGHGGRDPGAVANGMRESEIVLDVSLRLADILQSAGIETRLSRTGDTDLAINQRWRAANDWGATHFVSVHANAGGGTGVEMLIPTASPNNPSRDLQANRRFAETVSKALGVRLNLRVRRANGVMLETETRHGSIGVLRHTKMLAVLPEIGFIDSPPHNPDVEILRNRRQDIAQALADGILQFLGLPTIASTPSSASRFPLSEMNIMWMAEIGVIRSPEFWRTVDNVQWLDELLANSGREGVLDQRVVNGMLDAYAAIDVLEMAGVISTPEYWRGAVQGKSVMFLGKLLANIANRALDPMHRIVRVEAGGEHLKGQVAVANVIINRHNNPRFPDGFYNVIHENRINSKGERVHQFTPVANGMYAKAVPDYAAITAVGQALSGVDYSQGATFFHSISGIRQAESEGREVWHERATREGKLIHLFDHGNHRFYKEAS